MLLDSNKQLLVSSLIDEMLNELTPLSSFMRPKEYKKVYDYSKNWKSREWFLTKFFFSPLDLSPNNEDVIFDIKLYAMEKSNTLSDAFAIIPYEFQYIKRENNFDIILLRMYLDSESFRIASIEVSQDVHECIQNHFQQIQEQKSQESISNIFDLACYQCVCEYSERIFRSKGEFYEHWEAFQKEFEEQNGLEVREYSDVGKYLWQSNYLCFDNRFKKGDKIITILEQFEKYQKQALESAENRKKGLSAIKSMFIDEFGNYWKSEKAYLNYKKS